MAEESPEGLTEKEISELKDRIANAEDVIKNFEDVIAIPSEVQVKAYEDATKQKKLCEEKLAYDKLLKDRVKLVEKGEVKKEDLPTENEFIRSVSGAFDSKNTPNNSATILAQDPKVKSAFNSTAEDSSKKAANNIEKKTGFDPVSVAEEAANKSGSSITTTDNNNVGQTLNAIVQNPGFIAKMKDYASSFGSHIISNLPAYLILGVVIATLVLILKAENLSPASAVQAAAQQLSGCYMIYGDGKDYNYIKLDGCSDWYSQNTDNSIKCRCNNTDDVSKAIDCKGNDKDLPYCIGAADDTSPGQKKCINPNDKNTPPSALLKCQGEVGQSGTFVRYTSNFEDAIGIIVKLISLVEVTGGDTTDTTNVTNVTKNSIGMVGKILIGVVIIVTVLILGLIIYNTFFQNRNTIKSISRR